MLCTKVSIDIFQRWFLQKEKVKANCFKNISQYLTFLLTFWEWPVAFVWQKEYLFEDPITFYDQMTEMYCIMATEGKVGHKVTHLCSVFCTGLHGTVKQDHPLCVCVYSCTVTWRLNSLSLCNSLCNSLCSVDAQRGWLTVFTTALSGRYRWILYINYPIYCHLRWVIQLF